MQTIVAAIHGILTRQTDASWPDKLDAWMLRRDASVKVLKKEYAAGPFPIWNCRVKDPLLARGLANELELFLGRPDAPAIWFVAHSNGAVIALLAARSLIARGHKVGGLILTGAACEADVAKNGILEWRKNETLCRAIAYCSANDRVLDGDSAHPSAGQKPSSTLHRLRQWLWGKLIWPYGCLGRTGGLLNGQPATSPGIFTRRFSGGHTGYFSPEKIEETFEKIYAEIRSAQADVKSPHRNHHTAGKRAFWMRLR